MKLYPPIYPGDSILQPGTVPGSDAETVTAEAAFQAGFVRSSIAFEGAPESSIDMVSIEEQARAARSAWIGSQLKSFYAALAHKVAHARQATPKTRLVASKRVCEQ